MIGKCTHACGARARGLTLVELLVVMAVAAVIVSVSLPDFGDFVQNNRNATHINDLHSSLTFARSEAIRRNTTVAVCKSLNGTSCNNTGTAWQHGWIVFQDSDLDGVVDDASDVLSVRGAFEGEVSLAFTPTRVIYRSDGLASSGGSATFTLCDDRGAAYARGLIIGPSGRPRTATDSDDNGVVEDFDGDDLVCS